VLCRTTSRIGYRVRQFVERLRFQQPVEEAALGLYLNPAQVRLFWSMPVWEQQHALKVWLTLQQAGHTEAALAQAALLHDVGKTKAHVGLAPRVVKVLLQAVQSALLPRLAADKPGHWRYPFFILLHHAVYGAEMAAQADTDALALQLIRWHETAPGESGLDLVGQALLSALQAADNEN